MRHRDTFSLLTHFLHNLSHDVPQQMFYGRAETERDLILRFFPLSPRTFLPLCKKGRSDMFATFALLSSKKIAAIKLQ